LPETGGQERTERATPKRRQQAREKGQVAQSREVSSVVILMTALGLLYFSGSWMLLTMGTIVAGVYQSLGTLRLDTVADLSVFSIEIFRNMVRVLAPLFLLLIIAGIAANVLQFGFGLFPKKLVPKLTQLNPASGIKRIFSLKSLVELVKSILKLVVVGWIAYGVISGHLKEFPALVDLDVGQILVFTGQVAFKITLYVCLAMLLMAALDFIYQRWQFEKNLKMTKQEVKDEHKQVEGDPKVKGRIRSMQREVAMRRMMESVPEADVVITNPTHLAIALRFDADNMVAPRVVAKGADHIAARIREIAAENDVPLVENKPLAQALYRMVELGDYIPAELYRAVAEVLAYVYRLKGRFAGE
jgi:flagellar biosynthetic protein FlhB